MPTAPLRVVLAQTAPVACDLGANLQCAQELIAQAAALGAGLIVFPELSLTGYELDHLATTPRAWITPDDARLDGVREACRRGRITAMVGAAYAVDGARPWLAALIIDGEGRVTPSPKEHLHGREREVFTSGSPLAPFEVAGWRVASAVCFDAARPEHAARAAAQGADVYAVSAIYTPAEERRMDLHLGARAMDHRMFSVLANGAGRTGPLESCGLSGAWRPNGDVLVRASVERLLVADLDGADLAPYRT